jgi:CTP:molybdopterin cytidylyltransferase MocA/SAM-dependent methyltransferase
VTTTALVLAAGAGSRFGGGKLLAPLAGRAVLQHVLDTLAVTPVAEIVVVLGTDAPSIEAGIAWRDERRMINSRPQDGLASSLRIGLDAAADDPATDAVLVVLGDQPGVRSDVISALLEAADVSDRPIVRPRYADDAAPNPVLVRRNAWALAAGLEGDRGLGPLLAAHPELVHELPVPGANPDVDTPGDLARLVEAAWADRVRANREQVERYREIPDGTDFYAPVSQLFRADPDRDDEPALDLLRTLVVPGETWLDVGAGAGRYALPLARIAGEVIALEPSGGMLDAMRDQVAEHAIDNVRIVQVRWPPDAEGQAALGPFPCADVGFIAHVGYDIEAIGPFLDALEAASRRACVALLMARQPSSIADVCWPSIHGEARIPLPALPELLELLRARSRTPDVTMLEREPRRFKSRDELAFFLRRQLWIEEGGEKDRQFERLLDEVAVEAEDGQVQLRDQRPLPIGLVTWAPGGVVDRPTSPPIVQSGPDPARTPSPHLPDPGGPHAL